MSYNHVVILAQDYDFRMRIAACVASEGVTNPHPTSFADQIQWQVAAAPGMVEDYAYAVETNASEHPGKEEHIITDAQILSAVQPIVQKHLAEQDNTKRVQEQREAYELSMMQVETIQDSPSTNLPDNDANQDEPQSQKPVESEKTSAQDDNENDFVVIYEDGTRYDVESDVEDTEVAPIQ